MSQHSDELVDIYRLLLSLGGMNATEEGHVSTQLTPESDKYPTLVNGKRLMLPTELLLSGKAGDEVIGFHPLRESLIRFGSKVISKYRDHLTHRANYVLGSIMLNLLELAVNTDKHPKLTPDQTAFLSIVKNVDSKTVARFTEIFKKVLEGEETTTLVHIYLRKSGIMGGQKLARVSNVNFPIYEELLKEPEKGSGGSSILGVKLRIADREALLGLFQYVLPDIHIEQAYWGGSTSELAPTMQALLESIDNFGTDINSVAALFSNYIDDVDTLTYDLDYVPILKDIEKIRVLINSVPMLDGNEGALPNSAKVASSQSTPATIAAPTAPVEAPSVQIQSSPYLNRQAAPVAEAPPPPWAAQAPAPAVYQPYQPPVVQQVQQPVPAFIPNPAYNPTVHGHYPQGYYPPAAPVPAPALVVNEGGVNVASLFQSNPTLAQQVNQQLGFRQQPGYGYQAPPVPGQRSSEPRWSQPQQGYGQPHQSGRF